MDLIVYQMSYTDSVGNVYSHSAWLPAQINIGVADRNAHIVWYGYKDKASALIKPIPGAVKDYVIEGAIFQEYVASQLQLNPPPFIPQVFSHALNTLDVPDGIGGYKSFFDGAVQA